MSATKRVETSKVGAMVYAGVSGESKGTGKGLTMIFLCLVTDVFCVAYRNDEVIGTKGVKGGTEV